MFVQFSVENFLSFKDEAMISMLASKRRSKSKLLDENSTFDALPDIKLLKTAVIYGANGSGKSNLFKAIRFMKNLTINSSKESQAEEEIEITPFLASTKTPNKPSRFEMIFISNETLFQYEFSVSRKRIEHEKLTAKFKSSEKEKVLFERTQDKISVKAPFPEGKGLEKRTRDNA
ncbi:ATP-binding protein, partial [Pseudomonas aeruginosa]|nr:ATP-binding protein [Pseudomonas aeruginosa]